MASKRDNWSGYLADDSAPAPAADATLEPSNWSGYLDEPPPETRVRFVQPQTTATQELGTLGYNVARGVADVPATAAKVLSTVSKYADERAPFLRAIDDATGLSPERTLATLEAQRQAYEADPRSHGAEGVGSRAIGNLVGAAPIMAGGGALATLGGNALTRAVPMARPVVNFLAGESGQVVNPLTGRMEAAPGALNYPLRYASQGAKGAAQGATGVAAVSGGSDQPIADQAMLGGALGFPLGAAAPAVRDLASYSGNALKGLIAPLTETGREGIARNAVNAYARGPLTIDAREIVPGSRPTLAEAAGNPNVANLQRTARDLNANPFAEREKENAAARVAHLGSATGTAADVESAQAALDTQAARALSTVFRPGQVASAAPVVATIDGILAGSGGKRPAVQKALGDVRSLLVDDKGAPISADPKMLYDSVRKHIGDMLDPKSALASPAGLQAARELKTVKNVLDDAISAAAPGFDKYLADYAAAAQPIKAMKYLQARNLTNAEGNITLAKVQDTLKNIGKMRMEPGTNGAKALSEAQIDVLTQIRDDLLRAQHVNAGRSLGSPTVQNAVSQNLLQSLLPGRVGQFAGKVNPMLPAAAIGEGLGYLVGAPPVVGTTAGAMLGKAGGAAMNHANAAVQQKIENLLLNPAAIPAPSGPGHWQNFVDNRLSQGLQQLPLPGAIIGNRLSVAPRPAFNEAN